MKEHEDDVFPYVMKSTVTIDSTAVVEIVTGRLGGGEGKTLGFLTEKDEGEDTIVDVVGSDALEDDHGRAGVNLDSSIGSEELFEALDQDMEDVAGSGEYCDGSVGIRVLTSEKAGVVVNEEEVAGSCEYCDGSVETRVLASDKVETIVSEEELNTSAEASQDILHGNVVTTVASGSNGGIAVIERGFSEEVVESVEEVADKKIAESSILTSNFVSEEVGIVDVDGGFSCKDEAADGFSVDSSLVCASDQCSVADLVNARTDKFDERNKEDCLQPETNVITDDCQGNETVESLIREPMECSQEVNDGDFVVNEEIGKGSKVLDSSYISEPSNTMNSCSEDVDMVAVEEGLDHKDEAQDVITVGPSLVCRNDRSLLTEVVESATVEGEINVHADNLDQQAEVDKLCKQESVHPAIEVIYENGSGVGDSKLDFESLIGELQFEGETAVMVKEDTRGLTKNEDIVEHPTGSIQEVAYGNGVMDERTGKGDEVADSPKIPELLTTVDLGQEAANDVALIAHAVKHLEFSYENADMERGEDTGMDIDEVPAWKDEIPRDVTSGAEKYQLFDMTANSEVDVEPKLQESSSEPVQIEHQQENYKSREPIVYERRVHVEVPLYGAVDGSRSPASEDENLKIETDSEEDEDDDDDIHVQEEDQKAVRQVPEVLANGNSFSLHQSYYFQPPEKEGEYSVYDLVWGKVRSHPWWPGQIIDPSNASKKAMKYYKKDCFLVAYFGDHTFAWNNSAVLKPFRPNFSQIEEHANLEMFQIAVKCALEEVARRVELGLACSCVPKDIYKRIEYQVIENGGVRNKSNKRHGKDESASVSSFKPDEFVGYVRLLAQFPDQADKMDLTMAKAQLSSYGHCKGYRELPEFWDYGDMLEDVSVHENVEQLQVYKDGENFEKNLIETANPNKELSLSDITDDAPESGGGTSISISSSGLKKRKARGSISNGSVKRPNRHPNKVSTSLISTPKPSFKIGEVIQRVASQLAGPPAALKSNSGTKIEHADQNGGSGVTLQTPENSKRELSVSEMLSQLHLTAQDPMKGYSFLQTIIPFFYECRAAIFSKFLKEHSTVERADSGTKRKASNGKREVEEFEFEFEFDDVNDSYWMDRIIQNHCEDQLLQDNQNGGVGDQVVECEPDKPAQKRRKSNKKHVFRGNDEVEAEAEVKEESEADKRRRENLATEVVLKFDGGIYFPSEIQLNKMFRRFGPLMESESEVDRVGCRARVVFKKCCDAEVAHSSAAKFNIFGSINVKL